MPSTDTLIQRLYLSVTDDDWRTARERGLELVADHLQARSAAWFTHGRGSRLGAYTEMPRSGFTRSQLAGLQFGDADCLTLPGAGQNLAFEYAHQDGALVSIVSFRWLEQPGSRNATLSAEAREKVRRMVAFLAEMSGLSMQLYVRRDEWLMRMGRQARGPSALVDARGWIYAATERFVESMGALMAAGQELGSELPFSLPAEVQAEGGSFNQGSMHLRVERMEGLYLLHARKPLLLDALSPRELQIARALGTGKTFKSVAVQCDIAVSTVANHATRIYRKLGVFRREDLMELLRTPGSSVPPTRPSRRKAAK